MARCEECKGSAGIFLCEACAAMTSCFHMFLCGCIIEPIGFFLLSCKSTRPNMKSAGWQRQLECAGPRSFAGVCRFVGREEKWAQESVAKLPCVGLVLICSTIEMLDFSSLGVRARNNSNSQHGLTAEFWLVPAMACKFGHVRGTQG
ncbi:unnamed protein product [Effrenium voratum]|nr:unnamed protein product [Effrenium voratum]